MTFYEELGIKPILNAATTYTALGGSLMPPEVISAMVEAAGSFVDMHELHVAAGRRLSELTRNDAAYVTSGCAAGLVLAIMGLRSMSTPPALPRFPGRDLAPYEVVMHAAHRIPYDSALALAGAEVRQIGNVLQTFDWELEQALTERTVAVLYVAGGHLPPGALPLPRVVEIAHEKGVPVLVDAAAQLPPVSNLWHFTQEVGADLVLFSGGKALRGPQASGFMVGRPDIIEAARQNGAPFQRWTRAMKVGKEEIVGLLAAVTRYVDLDHESIARDWRRTVDSWTEALGVLDGVETVPATTNEAGQPVPRVLVQFDAPGRAKLIIEQLAKGEPRVEVVPEIQSAGIVGFWLGPDQLTADETSRVTDIVTQAILACSSDD